MGNVKSFCCRDYASEIDDREERSRILSGDCDPSSENIYNDSKSAVSQQDDISYGSFYNGHNSKTMEQSALDKIYQKMALNVIDVAPGESMVIQPPEFMERQKAYQAKLNQIKTPLPLKLFNRAPRQTNSSFNTTLNALSPPTATNNTTFGNNNITNYIFTTNNLSSVSTTSSTISNSSHVNKGQEKRGVDYEPITADEVQLINETSRKSVQAIRNLKIISQEQVVAHFKP